MGDVDCIIDSDKGAGFTAYGDGIDRGVRLITLYENEPKKLKDGYILLHRNRGQHTHHTPAARNVAAKN